MLRGKEEQELERESDKMNSGIERGKGRERARESFSGC